MPKKKQIQTNGQVQDDKPTTLDEIWGYNAHAKYGTTDEDKYKEELNGMDRADLESHARLVGVTIPEGLDRLKGNLIRAFRVHVHSLQRPPPPLRTAPVKMDKTLEKILAEGK